MNLKDILKQQAEYTRNSDVTVEIVRGMPWVTIHADVESELFLEGERADKFINQCDAYALECPDMEGGEIELAVAYGYLDILL